MNLLNNYGTKTDRETVILKTLIAAKIECVKHEKCFNGCKYSSSEGWCKLSGGFRQLNLNVPAAWILPPKLDLFVEEIITPEIFEIFGSIRNLSPEEKKEYRIYKSAE